MGKSGNTTRICSSCGDRPAQQGALCWRCQNYRNLRPDELARHWDFFNGVTPPPEVRRYKQKIKLT